MNHPRTTKPLTPCLLVTCEGKPQTLQPMRVEWPLGRVNTPKNIVFLAKSMTSSLKLCLGRGDPSASFTPLSLKNFSFAYPLPVLKEPFSLRLTSPLLSYTQIAGRSFGHSPSYVTTLAICHQWTYSSISSKPKAQVESCGWALIVLLGESSWPSSSNHTKASKGSSSRFTAALMTQIFWMGFLCIGHKNPGSKNSDALKTYHHESEKCVTSSPTFR